MTPRPALFLGLLLALSSLGQAHGKRQSAEPGLFASLVPAGHSLGRSGRLGVPLAQPQPAQLVADLRPAQSHPLPSLALSGKPLGLAPANAGLGPVDLAAASSLSVRTHFCAGWPRQWPIRPPPVPTA
jgi:hypothetical protein